MQDSLAGPGSDTDVDLPVAGQRGSSRPRGWDVVAVIAVGGAIGAEGRYGLAVLVPPRPGEFPWATLATNGAGCLLIGVLMVVLTELAGRPHRLARPFLGVGVLGGFTTFSTYTVDTQQLVAADEARLALGYLLATLAAALLAVRVGVVLTRVVTKPRRREERPL